MLPELNKGLSAIMPTVYGQWFPGQAPALPYIVVVDSGRDDQFADNTHYYNVWTYRLEIYFNRKDPITEQKIESFLSANDWSWSDEGDQYIDTEKIFEHIYYVEKGEMTNGD
ncbi:hypothetical protein [Lacticaseibacillus brantae]|uniref:Uncharacterized protein n=1 Tax=Lacticaseibacillus brantae DSM 23927 TaxID=1423727 RepID=A0A0R2B104_9LACO|nr:hypothetical protein [Lacticaseibacillus brantae]KRM73008.1 hypothetical protein FC34_GL000728 [Lacticaseibacillus brantae DSM 23927]